MEKGEKKKKPMARGFGNHNFTSEQLAEWGRKGGRANAEQHKKRKALKDTIEILMNMPVSKGKVADIEGIRSFAELNGKNITVDQAIMIRLVQKALKGDLNAVAMIRDTVGEKPTDKMEIKDTTPVIISGEDDLSE